MHPYEYARNRLATSMGVELQKIGLMWYETLFGESPMSLAIS